MTTGTTGILIIGCGFGGIGMAIQLKKAGFNDFVILEKSDGVGGTWHDNTYPGAACDVQSHLYSFSFEPRPDWSRKFGRQPEIKAYIEACATKYDLYSHIHFQQEVRDAQFSTQDACWTVKTANGDSWRTRSVVSAVGQLNRPAWPNIPGLDDFQGKLFHSSRWDHDYDLTGKTVAVIGTGASAIQFVPEIAKQVKQLHLFQRSGAWVIPKGDRAFKQVEKLLFRLVPGYNGLYRDLIYWVNESRALAFSRLSFLLEVMAMSNKRALRKHVKDRKKRRQLLPDYKIGCKRILLSNDWFPAMARDNVDIVTDGIERITADGLTTRDGTHHKVDAILLGTGFKTTDFLTPMQITGLDGQDLNQAWKDGAEAFHGTTLSGFPNFYMLYGPNTN